MKTVVFKVDHDLNPSVDDFLVPNGYEKISFLKSSKVIVKIDGGNVASVNKCNTYYPKILPLN